MRVQALDAETKSNAFAAPNPVALHHARAFGPSFELVQIL
jgi:hypothetical protein